MATGTSPTRPTMSDWIHCNKCKLRFNSNIKFYLTECGHIICHRCVERIKSTKKCNVCNQTASVIALNGDLDQSIAILFMPIEEINRKMLEVYQFQSKNRMSLYQTILNKYNHAKKECINYMNLNKKLKQENEYLKSLQVGMNPPNYVTSTPSMQDTGGFDNLSTISVIPPLNFRRTNPGYMQRVYTSNDRHSKNLFTPSDRPSPVQMVPVHRKNDNPMIYSLEQLKRQ